MLPGEMRGIQLGGNLLGERGHLELLEALETLKKFGYTQQDAREIWCSEWITCVFLSSQSTL